MHITLAFDIFQTLLSQQLVDSWYNTSTNFHLTSTYARRLELPSLCAFAALPFSEKVQEVESAMKTN